MRKLTVAFLAVTTLLIAAVADAGGPQFRARLSGDQEVPPTSVDARGQFSIHFDKALTKAEFTLTVRDLEGVFRAHLHCNATGVNGPIFIHLMGDLPVATGSGAQSRQNIDGKWLSNATLTDQGFSNTTTPCGDTLAEVVAAANACNVYVNVHTVDFPGGAIRGQLVPSDHH